MGEMNSMAIDDCIGAIQLAGGPSLPPLFQDLDIQAPRLVISDSMTMGQAWAAQVIKAMPLLEGRLERVLSASSGIYPAAESRSIDGWKDTVERRSHRGTAGVLRDTIDTSAAGNDWLIVLEARGRRGRRVRDRARGQQPLLRRVGRVRGQVPREVLR